MRRRDALLLAFGFEGGLLILAWLLGWLFDQPPRAQTHWRWNDFGIGVAATAPLLLGLLICIRWPIGPLRTIKGISEEFIRPLFRGCTMADLALISLVAGFGEEPLPVAHGQAAGRKNALKMADDFAVVES